jgi:hypothetical protein
MPEVSLNLLGIMQDREESNFALLPPEVRRKIASLGGKSHWKGKWERIYEEYGFSVWEYRKQQHSYQGKRW